MHADTISEDIVPAQAGKETSQAATYLGESEMPAREERLTILRMVEEGKISPEEGAKLLGAIGESQETQAIHGADEFDMSNALRIRVTDIVTGQQKVNVNLPVGLVRFGLRFIPKSADVDVQAIQSALDSGLRGRIVDVIADEDGKRVEIFVE